MGRAGTVSGGSPSPEPFHGNSESSASRSVRRMSLSGDIGNLSTRPRQRLFQRSGDRGSGGDVANSNRSVLRRQSLGAQFTCQDQLASDKSSTSAAPCVSSVADYQEVFKQVKQENKSSSVGALHQKTLIQLAEVKAEFELKEEHKREERQRLEKEARLQNRTLATKFVGRVVGRIVPKINKTSHESHPRLPQQHSHSISHLNTRPLHNSMVHTHRPDNNDLHQQRNNATFEDPRPRRRASLSMIMRRHPVILEHTPSTRRRTIQTTPVTNLLSKVEMACASHIGNLYTPSHDEMFTATHDEVNFAPRKSVGGSMHSVRSVDDDSSSEAGESSAELSDVTSEYAEDGDAEEVDESVRSRLSGLSMRADVKQNDGHKKKSPRKHAAKTQKSGFKHQSLESAWVSAHVTAMPKLPTPDDLNSSPKSGILKFTAGDDSNHTHDDRSSSGLIVGFVSRDNSDHVDDEGGLIVGFGDRTNSKR